MFSTRVIKGRTAEKDLIRGFSNHGIPLQKDKREHIQDAPCAHENQSLNPVSADE